MTELIWDGKYKDGKKQGPVRIALPFQTIETVNESVQERQRTLEIFAAGRETEWRNRLIWGDKKYVLPSLLPEFAGKVNLIYIDPPFDTGADFSYTATIPDHPDTHEDETTEFTKEPSILEQKAYRDTWGRGLDSYLQWFYETALLLGELLAEDGSIYVHLDWHLVHYAKAVMDEVFGASQLVNEIIWRRKQAAAWSGKGFGITNDTLLYYVNTDNYTFNPEYSRDDDNTTKYIAERFTFDDGDGRKYMKSPLVNPLNRPNLKYVFHGVQPPPNGWLYSKERLEEMYRKNDLVMPANPQSRIYRKIFLDEYKGQIIQNIWTDIPIVNPMATERLGFPTQKPEALLERIIKASSNEGDLALDCFVGSGTTAAVAEKLNRRWIACDLGRFAIHTTRKRLLGIPNVRPFVVQNLGKYERQAWQAAEFESPVAAVSDRRQEESGGQRPPLQREMAYRKFILNLYHATAITGRTWLHGTKGSRMVHVGAVDAPVTLADVKAIAKELWKSVGTGGSRTAPTESGGNIPVNASVDILGWEFAFELNETAKQIAAESRVNVAFKKIPREVLDKKAIEQGDVQFFELAALSVGVKQKKREITLKLTDFVIPTDDIPVEVRKAIKHWSQMIDYWAVDWDYKGDTFHNQWQAYRTRKNPKIELETTYKYPEPGRHTVLVKVIDILGNDTTKTLEIGV
jgi:DNA modification methylase